MLLTDLTLYLTEQSNINYMIFCHNEMNEKPEKKTKVNRSKKTHT